MTQPAVSVIVVSKGRGKSLALTLTGLIRQLYAPYEIIVVADAEGISTVKAMWLEDKVKAVPFADPNISLARNIGVSVAAGEVIAFLDDDAVPEPTWLTHLTAPFNDPQVSAVGGYVIGRNGISFQWTARAIDYAAREVALDVEGDRPVALTPPRGQAVKTEGTNMAFRRSDLVQVGGFDPAYHFYLDDADLNMRLAKAGRVTAIAPLAQVHHAFAPSPRRGADRVPKDLYEIGASLQVYLRRHCPEAERAAVIDQFRADQQARLHRFRRNVEGRQKEAAKDQHRDREQREKADRVDRFFLGGYGRGFGCRGGGLFGGYAGIGHGGALTVNRSARQANIGG